MCVVFSLFDRVESETEKSVFSEYGLSHTPPPKEQWGDDAPIGRTDEGIIMQEKNSYEHSSANHFNQTACGGVCFPIILLI